MCNIFERLQAERKKMQLNQEQMAKLGGVSKRSYCHYEAGERVPDANFLAAIASAGADVGYILTGNRAGAVQSQGQTTNPPVDIALLESVIDSLETALLRHGRKLDPSRKARAIAVLYECCADKGSEAQAHINSLLEDMV